MRAVAIMLIILLLLVGSMVIVINDSPQYKNNHINNSIPIVYLQQEGNKFVAIKYASINATKSNSSLQSDSVINTFAYGQNLVAYMVQAPTKWSPYFSTGGTNATAGPGNAYNTGSGTYFMAVSEYHSNGSFIDYSYAGINFYAAIVGLVGGNAYNTTYTAQLLPNYIFKYSNGIPINPVFTNATAYLLNLSVVQSSINFVLPYVSSSGNYNYKLVPITFQASYSINSYYNVNFYTPNHKVFNLTINNKVYKDVSNLIVPLKNGSYSYTVQSGNSIYNNTIYINGNNLTINVLVFTYLSSQTIQLIAFLSIVIGLMIVIMRYTDGSLIYLGASGILFTFIGYSLGVPYFNTSLLLLFVFVIVGLFSYKMVME